mgnify:CR=1 FL=1
MKEPTRLHRELFAAVRTRTKVDPALSNALENIANLAYDNKQPELREALLNAAIEFPSVKEGMDKITNLTGTQKITSQDIERFTKDKVASVKKQTVQSAAVDKDIRKDAAIRNFPKKSEGNNIDSAERLDGINTLIFGELYSKAMPHNKTNSQIMTVKTVNPSHVFIRTDFPEKATTLAHFKKTQNSKLTNKSSNLQNLETVIAASHLFGDMNYAAGSLMVHKSGSTSHDVIKTDYTKSGNIFTSNMGTLLSNMNNRFDKCNYTQAIASGSMKFDVREFSKSLNQMLTQVSKDEIKKTIDQKVKDLEKAGFDPYGIVMHYNFSDNEKTFQKSEIQNYDDLSRHFNSVLHRNLDNMKEVAKGLGVVAKYSNASPQFMNGQWVKDMAVFPIKDPVLYAAHHNIDIEGKNALEWARDNNYKVANRVVGSTGIERTNYIDPVNEMLDVKLKHKLPLSISESRFINNMIKSGEVAKGSAIESKIQKVIFNAPAKTFLPAKPITLKDKPKTEVKENFEYKQEDKKGVKIKVEIDGKRNNLANFTINGLSFDTKKLNTLNTLLDENKVDPKSFVKNLGTLGKKHKFTKLSPDQIVEKTIQAATKNKAVGLEQYLGRKPEQVEAKKPKGIKKLFAKLKGLGKVKKADGIQAPDNLPSDQSKKTSRHK